jgi:DNA-binding transcriptional ArsR family regulator
VFAVLANPTRRCLVELLRQHEQTPAALGAAVGLSQPALSQHLALMRRAGVVTVRPVGRARHYRLQPTALIPALAWLDTQLGPTVSAEN